MGDTSIPCDPRQGGRQMVCHPGSNNVGSRKPLQERPVNLTNRISLFNNGDAGKSANLNHDDFSTSKNSGATSTGNMVLLTKTPNNQGQKKTPRQKIGGASSGRSGNAPFKSPITLCFERMLGAGRCLDLFQNG